ncbi:hypothetical protein HWV62_32341 [Athelia sp. TMB]|nr:hypothetical protein HWV62_32341 [Athelia sp. TMB]
MPVVPRLRELTEKTVGQVLFNPAPSTDSILAMIVLALWMTVGAASAAPRDERLIIAAAVSMAVNLRLNDAVAYLSRLKSATSDGTDAAVDIEDVIDKARLGLIVLQWLCLTNVESMLCMGTGRLPLSPRNGSDCDVLEWSPASSTTLESGRDVRLALSGKIYATTEAGLRLRFARRADLEIFYLKSVEIFSEFDYLGNFLTPLSETRDNYAEGMPLPKGWYKTVVYNGICLPEFWGKQALFLSQDILASAISRFEQSADLSMMPDSAFAMICYTAAYLVHVKISALQAVNIRIPGSSDMLLQRTREILMSAVCAPDHIPAHGARFIAMLVDSYEAQVRESLQHQPADGNRREGSPHRTVPQATGSLLTIPSPSLSNGRDHDLRSPALMHMARQLDVGLGTHGAANARDVEIRESILVEFELALTL